MQVHMGYSIFFARLNSFETKLLQNELELMNAIGINHKNDYRIPITLTTCTHTYLFIYIL